MPQRHKGRQFLQGQKKLFQAAEALSVSNYRKAERLIVESLQLQPQCANSFYIYSIVMKNKGLTDRSTMLFNKAMQLNPCYYHTQNYKQKQILKNIIYNYNYSLKQMLDQTKTNEFKWQQLINFYAKYKDLQTNLLIMDLFQKFKRADNDYQAHLFSCIGISYYESAKYKQSLQKYQTAITLKPSQYRYYNNSAILEYIFGNYQKSKEFFKQSLVHNPGYPKSQFIVSFSLCKTGQHEQAYKKILYAISKDKTLTMYRFKALSILLTYMPQRVQQINKQLTQTEDIIKNDKDEDTYFYNKDNRIVLKSSIDFLRTFYQQKSRDEEKWKKYLQLMDWYLIKGHHDKFYLSQEMKIIEENMTLQLARSTYNLKEQYVKQEQVQNNNVSVNQTEKSEKRNEQFQLSQLRQVQENS